MISGFGALVQAHFIRPPSVLAMAQQYPCSSMPQLPFTVSTCLMVESVQEWQSCSSCHCCCCAELHPNPNRFEFIHPLLQSKHVRCEFDDVVKLQWALTASIQTLKLTVYYVDHVTSLRRLLTALAGSLQLKRIVEKAFCNFCSDFMGDAVNECIYCLHVQAAEPWCGMSHLAMMSFPSGMAAGHVQSCGLGPSTVPYRLIEQLIRNEIFSPVICFETVQCMLALATPV